MNKNKPSILSFVLLATLSVTNSHAEFDPGVIKAGGIDITPTVDILESYDSNVFYSESDKKSAMITVVKPNVSATIEKGANKYSIEAGASFGRYSSGSSDNYVDSNLGFDLHQSFTRKANLDISAGRLNTHESRGLGYSIGDATSLSEPDEYHIDMIDSQFSYGSKDAIGQIVFNIYTEQRTYDSRKDVTKFRNRNLTGGGVTFYYHLMPKTSLLFELDHRALAYSNNDSYDSTEQRLLIGTRWDVSALTSGKAKVGLLEKNFDVASRTGSSIVSWEIGARWTPLSYSVFDIITKGNFEETDGDGDYIDSKTALVQWTHFWNKSLNTAVDLNLTKNSYQDSDREDDYKSIGLRADYNLRRWLNVGLGYTYSANQSSQNNSDYDKNVVTLGFEAAL